MTPLNAIGGSYWMSLGAFYDGSGKVHDPGCRFLNLGSLIGSKVPWDNFAIEWSAVLEKHSAPLSPKGNRYFHSNEAMHQQDGYKGWSSANAVKLIDDLIILLGKTDRTDPLAISCSINLEDYRKVKADIPALRSPEKICIDMCFWLAVRHPSRKLGMKLTFDRHENFYPILKKVLKEKDRGRPIWWAEYILSIEEAQDSRDSPGVQAADLLAWLANRYCTHGSGDQWGAYFYISCMLKQHHYRCVDEQALRSLYELDGEIKSGVQLTPTRIGLASQGSKEKEKI